MELVFCLIPASVNFSVWSRFAIFDNFTTEPIRITMLLDNFLRGQFSADFLDALISHFDGIFNIGNMLLEVLVVKQVIFRKIVQRLSSFFQIIQLCPAFKAFTIACDDIGGDIDIKTSFSG